MPFQTATNVLAALKRETTFGDPPGVVTGADRIRIIDSPGMKLTRANIESEERRSDQLEAIGRLGGKSGAGSYNTEVNPGGDFDSMLEDLVRGTQGALAEEIEVDAGGVGVGTRVAAIITPAVPIYRSYSIEQRDVDIDGTELFLGSRIVSANFSFAPGEMAKVTWQFQSVDRTILQGAASPFYTDPVLTTGLPLIADDAIISYQGAPIAVVTGMNINVVTDAALQPVIGNFVSPDVFMNKLRVSGDIMAVRETLDALADFEAETEFEIKMVLQAPTAAPKHTFAVIMRRCKIYDVAATFVGGDAAKVETRQFRSHPVAGASNAVEFYTSTETPVLV